MLWLQFLICAAVIIAAGSRLAAYADIISGRSKISAGLMGILFLAAITSFPELFTSLGSVTVVNAPDLAIGNIVGAIIINVFVIALLGVLSGKGSMLKNQSRANIFAALLTILMLFVIIASISAQRFVNMPAGLWKVSFGSIFLAGIYIGGMVIIYRRGIDNTKLLGKGVPSLLKIKFLIAAAVIVTAGFWLAAIGKRITDFYNWKEMYVGVLLVAIVTTMPEFIVSLTAIRRNSVYMAAGNLLGSNFFNLFIIPISDIFFRKGEFLASVSKLNVFPAILAIILTAIAVGAMLNKTPTRTVFRHFSWDSVIIISVFIIGHYLLYRLVYAAG